MKTPIPKLFVLAILGASAVMLMAPAESQAAKSADGQRCSTNSACQSGSCTPGPSLHPNSSGPKYCLNRNLNCALPGKAGARYGQNYATKTNTLKCLNPAQYGWGRLSAQFMLPERKGPNPKTKVPLKNVELCVGAIHARSYYEYEAYVTEGTCRGRGGGWYPGAVITLAAITPARGARAQPPRRRYSNYNYKPSFWSSGSDVYQPTCAAAFARLDDGRVLKKVVCNRRSYQ